MWWEGCCRVKLRIKVKKSVYRRAPGRETRIADLSGSAFTGLLGSLSALRSMGCSLQDSARRTSSRPSVLYGVAWTALCLIRARSDAAKSW